MRVIGPEALCRRSGYFLAGLGLFFSVARGDPDWTTASNKSSLAIEGSEPQAAEWTMHYIHRGPIIRKGADGIDTADVNSDGYPDVVAAWQHASRAIVYLNPGSSGPRNAQWMKRVHLEAGDIEDSKFADLNGDGSMDVITASETTRKMYIHWAPGPSLDYLDESGWTRQRLDRAARLWVQAEAAQLDGAAGLDVIAGAMKEESSRPTLYWYRAPSDPRTMEWEEYVISNETPGIMSIETVDMDGDADLDIVTGARHVLAWLENPSPNFLPDVPWKMHTVDVFGVDASFLALTDLDRNGHVDIVATDYRDTQSSRVATWYRNHAYGKRFTSYPVHVDGERPFSGYKNGTKGVACGDVNGDGKVDLVFTTHVGVGSRVFWLEYEVSPTAGRWKLHHIRATPGHIEEKYDNLQLCDLDRDGDLDVVTSEENLKLGVIWFENPLAKPGKE